MRLFVGIDIPAGIKAGLGELIDRLRPSARLRWSPPDNFHITTKFIGEWPEDRLDEMKTSLAAVHGAPFSIAIRGLGWFPNPHSPRIFWAAVRAPEALGKLAAATEDATAGLGVEKEKRPYSPHLTLARIGEPTDLAEMRRRIAGLESDDFGEFAADTFHLYLSRPADGGSVYSRLASFPLGSNRDS